MAYLWEKYSYLGFGAKLTRSTARFWELESLGEHWNGVGGWGLAGRGLIADETSMPFHRDQ
jgi:hypothetical protein